MSSEEIKVIYKKLVERYVNDFPHGNPLWILNKHIEAYVKHEWKTKESAILDLALRNGIEIPKVKELIENGKEDWSEYQVLCKKILTYLFVPPLIEPLEQSPTETRLHIRDLIFDIPYNISGFWAYIRDRFDSSALIVECKNYSSPIKGNQIVISDKYLGKNKLGRFGIVFSRLNPDQSAIRQAKSLWNQHNELILCLTDSHLAKMLELKEKNKEPEIVIDNAIHEFLRALE